MNMTWGAVSCSFSKVSITSCSDVIGVCQSPTPTKARLANVALTRLEPTPLSFNPISFSISSRPRQLWVIHWVKVHNRFFASVRLMRGNFYKQTSIYFLATKIVRGNSLTQTVNGLIVLSNKMNTGVKPHDVFLYNIHHFDYNLEKYPRQIYSHGLLYEILVNIKIVVLDLPRTYAHLWTLACW